MRWINLWSMRKLGRIALVRNAVHKAFSLYYRHGTSRTILAGPLAGMKWYCHREHQMWMPLGQYERETCDWLRSVIQAGMTFFDVGANAGYFVLLGSQQVKGNGRVIAFEPVPENVQVLKHQIRLNRLKNVTLENIALSDTSSEERLTVECQNANSHLSAVRICHAPSQPARVIMVKTLTVDDYVAQTGIIPDVLKLDVEGAERSVLQGARKTLSEARPKCVISTHSRDLKTQCRRFLESNGYFLENLPGFEHELVCYPR